MEILAHKDYAYNIKQFLNIQELFNLIRTSKDLLQAYKQYLEKPFRIWKLKKSIFCRCYVPKKFRENLSKIPFNTLVIDGEVVGYFKNSDYDFNVYKITIIIPKNKCNQKKTNDLISKNIEYYDWEFKFTVTYVNIMREFWFSSDFMGFKWDALEYIRAAYSYLTKFCQ
jgi:hypothetical protein